MQQLTAMQLSKIMPHCSDPDGWVEPLNTAMQRFEIDTPSRIAAFLSQIAVESGELNHLVENLDYSAGRLMSVWPHRFTNVGIATYYSHQPERLANFVYAGRLGNGDEASGDGWRYRGRGLLQVTGRDNYRNVGEGIGLPCEDQPELLEQPGPAALSAAWFWQSRGLNRFADYGTLDDFERITARINGSLGEIDERIAYWRKAKAVISV